jgi:hypothetical protein
MLVRDELESSCLISRKPQYFGIHQEGERETENDAS